MAIPAGLSGMINEGPVVEPRPSASVLVVRGRSPWEVLLVRRPDGVCFAPGAHVFPGGSVHGEDAAHPDPLRAAAIRELFEEAGVLLARLRGRTADSALADRLRRDLTAGLTWRDAVERAGLELAFDRLTPLTRWVTPEQLRRRFDTRFFLARMPSRQEIVPQQGEIVDWRWAEPAGALGDPSVQLVHATRRILESVAGEEDAGSLIARLRRRRRIPSVRPRLIRDGEAWRIVEDAGE
ncbi:MAG: NUDIX domain-containing protein [Candidatus Dormibacteraceae bacterium]